MWGKPCWVLIHRKKFKAVRGLGLRLKREERWVGVREGIRVSKEGSFLHWGWVRMVKIWDGRSGSGEASEEEKGLRRKR